MNAVMNLRVPQNAGNFLTSLEPVSFSERTLVHGVSLFVYRSVGWLAGWLISQSVNQSVIS